MEYNRYINAEQLFSAVNQNLTWTWRMGGALKITISEISGFLKQ